MTARKRSMRRLGETIFDKRRVHGLTQMQLAARTGLSVHGVQGVEQERRPDPYFSTTLRIAVALGVSLDELVTEPEPQEE